MSQEYFKTFNNTPKSKNNETFQDASRRQYETSFQYTVLKSIAMPPISKVKSNRSCNRRIVARAVRSKRKPLRSILLIYR